MTDKVLLCAIAKQENKYIREWVDYHLNLGFDHITIYDNNDTGGERISDVLSNDMRVDIVDFRGKKQKSCETQVEAYNHCYKNAKNYTWVLFIDIDEFLWLRDYDNIKVFLAQNWVRKANVIRFHWKCYSDNDQLHYEDRPVMERFTEPCSDVEVNYHTKQMYRTNLGTLRIVNVHYSTNVAYIFYPDGKPAPYTTSTKDSSIHDELAHVKHYVTKSLEEYVRIKWARRCEGSSKTRLSMDFYFKYNKRTDEKVRYYRQLMNELKNAKAPTTMIKKSASTNDTVSAMAFCPGANTRPVKPVTESAKIAPNSADVAKVDKEYPFGVSVCISAWKTAEYIEECLDSVSAQTWFKDNDNYEILLGIDGCEETLAKVKEIMGKYKNLKVMMMDKNVGTYVTCNTIMKEAKYEWLLRFDSDDTMPNDMIAKIFTNDLKNVSAVRYENHNFGRNTLHGLAWGSHLVKHNVFDKFGGYRNWRISADFDFLYRISDAVNVKKIETVFYNRRVRENSLEFSKETSLKSETRKKLDEFVRTKSRNERCIKNETTQYISIFDNRISNFSNHKKYNGEKAIVSLTSWTKRINYVHETIDTISDKCKNTHIVLVLCENEFPKKEDGLPLELKKRFDKFEILWVVDNTRSYKKVIPTMEKYKNIPIISADDDLFYVRDYVTELVNLYNADKTFATYSYRHDKMVTNCGAATLYNPKYYDLFIGMLNPAIPDCVIEDDMFFQYVIEKNNLKQCFAKTSFPFATNKKNEIEALHNEYKIGTPTQRKENYYSKIDSILNAKIVVNLTTWTKRDKCLYPMLKNLKQQTLHPDKIVLWLSEEEYDKNKLPKSIQSCIDEKLLTDVMWVKKNTKGHKRYECFKYFDDAYNILLDDDILYKPNFLKELVSKSKKHQNCITVYSSRSVEYVGVKVTEGTFTKEPSHKNQFIAGRCCFPTHLFPKDSYEFENLRNEYVLNCDESWYRPFFIKHDIKINVLYQWDNSHYPTICDSQNSSLWNINRKILNNGMRDKERNFYNAIKITHTEELCKKIWRDIGITNWTLKK